MARRKSISLDELTTIINAGVKTFQNEDELDLYKPDVKAHGGHYSAIIRFLPPIVTEKTPFVKRMNHSWNDKNGWFIHNCPTTIGGECPVCRENGKIWSSDQDLARKRARKTSYYTNILVVKDKQNPDNEGKVFKYRYGIKIQEKIMAAINPPDPDMEEPINVFDYDKGANFKLIIKPVETNGMSFSNYDSSTFAQPSPIGMGKEPFTDEDLDIIDSKLFPLQPLIDNSQFKPYSFLASEFTKRTNIPIPTSPDEFSVNSNVSLSKEEIEIKQETAKTFSDDDDDIPVTSLSNDDDELFSDI